MSLPVVWRGTNFGGREYINVVQPILGLWWERPSFMVGDEGPYHKLAVSLLFRHLGKNCFD